MADSSLGEAVLDLRADGSQLDKDLQTAEGKAKSWTSGVGDVLKTGLGTALGFGLSDVTGKAIGAITDVFAGAKESAQVSAQLDAVLESTGGAAGVTADQAKDLAGALQETTLFTDETTLAGENMLLTFTNVGKDVFPQATETMLDMSQALGQDVKSSAIQLGKALNDPIHGVTALQRVGVTFTEEQKKQIETLAKSGQTMEEQKLILAELQKEFGGSAEAAANVEPFKVFNNLLDDIKENIAGEILPVINDLGRELIAWLKSPEVKQGLADLLAAFRTALPQAMGFLKSALPPLLDMLGKLAKFLWDNKEIIGAIVGALGALSVIGSVVGWVGGLVGILTSLGGVISAVVPVIGAIVAVLGGPLTLVIAAIIAAVALLVAAWQNDWGGIQEKTQAVVKFITDLVQKFLAAIRQFWTEHGAQITKIIQDYWDYITSIFQLAWDLISGIVKVALDLLSGDFDAAGRDWMEMMQNVWRDIQQVFENAWRLIQETVGAALGNLWNAISGKMQEIQTNIQTAWNNVTTWLGGLPAQMLTLGYNIVQGIIDGINSQEEAVLKALQGIVDGAIANIKAVLGIQSPSKFMRDQVGAQMAAGVRLGFEDGLRGLASSFEFGVRGSLATAGATGGAGRAVTLRPQIRITIGNREVKDFIVEYADDEITRVLNAQR